MENLFLENQGFLFMMIGIVFAWTLPWKAWALWKAARKGQIGWFLVILVVNSLAILEILYIFVFSRKKKEEDFSDEEKEEKAKKIDIPGYANHNMQKPKMVV